MRARVRVIFSSKETRSWDVPKLKLPGYVWWKQIWTRRCWFGSVFAKWRDCGASKRDVQRFSLEPLWWCKFTFWSVGMTWRCMKLPSRVSLSAAGRTPRFPHCRRCPCGDGVDVYRRQRPRGAQWDVRPFVLPRVRKRSWRFQETHAAWNHEGVQLQGYIHVVQVKPTQRYTLRQHKDRSRLCQKMGFVGSLPHLREDTRKWNCGELPCEQREKEVDIMEAENRCAKNWLQERSFGELTWEFWEICGHNTKTIEVEVGKVAHCTKTEKEKTFRHTPDNARGSCCEVHKSVEKKSRNKQGKPEQSNWLNAEWHEKNQITLSELHVNGHFTENREEWCRESCRGTAKRCTLTRRMREKYKNNELNASKRKVTNSSQWTAQRQRSQLIWCYRPGRRCLKTKATDLGMQLQARWSSSCPWRKSTLLRSVFRNASWIRWMLQVHGRFKNWCSCGNKMWNRRQGSEVTGPLRWHQWCRSGTRLVLFFVSKKKKESESWKKLHVWGVDGISCQHLQVMMTNLLQKHWKWQEETAPILRHGSANVLGKPGHQDGVRWGETEARGNIYGKP